MPSRNIVKVYVNDGYYHIYNRGVAKQKIFRDTQDYKVFLKYLKESLDKPVIKKATFSLRGRTFKAVRRPVKNFQNDISLLAYCLMPNHFHLLIKQNNKESMTSFLRSISTRYARYFNTKYERVGPLYQGKFKAVLIKQDEYLLHLSRYIHLNPSEYTKDLIRAYSSYEDYLGLRKTPWIKPDFVLKFFNNTVIPEVKKFNDYKSFMEKYKRDSAALLGQLVLE